MFIYLLNLPFRLAISALAAIIGAVVSIVEFFTAEMWRKFLGFGFILLGFLYAASTYCINSFAPLIQ